MSKEKGFLIFYDWIPAFEALTPKDFKALMLAMWRYQMDGTPPPEFSNKAKAIATFIFPQIDRRKYMSEIGRKGAEARHFNGDSVMARHSRGTSEGISEAVGAVKAQVEAESNSKSDSKSDSKSESDQAVSVSESGSEDALEPCGGSAADARAEGGTLCAAEEGEGGACGAPKGRGYGRHGNVYLSAEEYLELCRRIKRADDYIDRFSEKLHSKGYRYPNHFKTICEWWERDSRLENVGAGYSSPESPKTDGGSFETDEFFAAAVRRSLGEDAVEKTGEIY